MDEETEIALKLESLFRRRSQQFTRLESEDEAKNLIAEIFDSFHEDLDSYEQDLVHKSVYEYLTNDFWSNIGSDLCSDNEKIEPWITDALDSEMRRDRSTEASPWPELGKFNARLPCIASELTRSDLNTDDREPGRDRRADARKAERRNTGGIPRGA